MLSKTKNFLAVLVVLATSTFVLADLKVDGKATVDQYVPAELKASGSDTDKAGFIWDVYPEPVWTHEMPDGSMYFTGPPGTYQVKLRAVRFVNNAMVVTQASLKVVLDGTPLPPPPPPGPPTPPPGPVTPDKLVVVIVEDTASAAASRGMTFLDHDLNQRMADKGHRWRVVDKGVVGPDGKTPPADVAKLIADAVTKRLPQVYLVDSKGKIRVSAELPTINEPAFLLKLLTDNGG
jgi:hypothetical protein